MRASMKDFWRRQRTDLIVARITHCRIASLFFIITLLAFAAQIVIRALMYDTDDLKLRTITSFTNVPQGLFVAVEQHYVVKACDNSDVPSPRLDGTLDCPIIFTAGKSDSTPVDVVVPTSIQLCSQVLMWPIEIFWNEKRTDAAFLGLEVWLLILSIYAVCAESVPHLAASWIIRFLSTIWSFWELFEFHRHHRIYDEIITNGACVQFSRDPGFLGMMAMLFVRYVSLDIACSAFNAVSLGVLSFLAWKLNRRYHSQHFDRVGASENMLSIYRYVLLLTASFQISAFVLLTAVGLWISQLTLPLFSLFSTHIEAYQGVFITTLILLPFWILAGHYAVRKEIQWLMITFLAISTTLLIAWTFMFLSKIYRITFFTWAFFAAMTVGAVFLNLVTLVIGIICRQNFNKGLGHFLHVRQVLANSDFPPENFDYHPQHTMKSFVQQAPGPPRPLSSYSYQASELSVKVDLWREGVYGRNYANAEAGAHEPVQVYDIKGRVM